MKDFYYILGVNADCTLMEIKDAYRKLSKKFHPDLNQNDQYFESRFRELQEAYETLSDPARRRRYDAAFKNQQPAPELREPVHRPFKTTGIDIGFSIVLIIITLVFGSYVIKAMNGEGTHIAKILPLPSISGNVVLTTPKLNKKHHHPKIKSVNLTKVNPDVHSLYPVQPVIDKPAPLSASQKTAANPVNPAAPAKIAAVVIPAADTIKNRPSKNFLYTTTIKSNITGVTNMHQAGNYGSAIVKVIPNNSKVLVLEKGSNYYKVQFDNASGYVPKWTLASN